MLRPRIVLVALAAVAVSGCATIENNDVVARVHDVEATLEAFRVRSEIRRALAAEQLVQDSGAASSDPA